MAYCCKICVMLGSHMCRKCMQWSLTDKLLTVLYSFKGFNVLCQKKMSPNVAETCPGVGGRSGLMDLSCASCVSGTALNRCVTFNIFFSLWLLSNSQWKNFTWRSFRGAFSPLEYVLAQRWASSHVAVTTPPCCWLVVLMNDSLIFSFWREGLPPTEQHFIA